MRLFRFAVFLFILFLGTSEALKASKTPIPQGTDKLTYNSDGHFWTVYLVGVLLNMPEARELALYAENPDHIMDTLGNITRGTYTWLDITKQGKYHALTGKNPQKERERSRKMYMDGKDVKQRGRALHRLGDSYAHARPDESKMYARGFGHAFTPEGGHEPDMIRNYPDKYLEYVNDLIRLLSGGKAEKVDMSAFIYVATKKLETADNIEILKSALYLQLKAPYYDIQQCSGLKVYEFLETRKDWQRFSFSMEDVNPRDKKNRLTRVKIQYN